MMPPQWGMLTIGARPSTLPVRTISVIFVSVLNSLRKSGPESDGIAPPIPRSPWHWPQANWTKTWAPAATSGETESAVTRRRKRSAGGRAGPAAYYGRRGALGSLLVALAALSALSPAASQ